MILCLMLTMVRKMIFFYDTWRIMLHYSISAVSLSSLSLPLFLSTLHIISVPLYVDAGHNVFARFKVFMAILRARTPRLDIIRYSIYCCRKIGVKLQLLIAVNKLNIALHPLHVLASFAFNPAMLAIHASEITMRKFTDKMGRK